MTIVAAVPITVVRFAREHDVSDALFRGLPGSVRPGPQLGVDATLIDVAALFDRLAGTSPQALARFADYCLRRVPLVVYAASFAPSLGAAYAMLCFIWQRTWPALNVEAQRTRTGWAMRARTDEEIDVRALLGCATEILRRLPEVIGGTAVVTVCASTARASAWRVDLARRDHTHDDPERLLAIADLITPSPRPRPEWRLTDAEARVANLLAAGHSINEIAALSRVSRETVRTQVKRALGKAGVRRQIDLVLRLRS